MNRIIDFNQFFEKRVQSLEGLRAILSFWVVIGHIFQMIGMNISLISHNVLAVDVFMILSGYVIFRHIDQRRQSYRIYITRRFFRLFPLYLCILVISAILLPIALGAMQTVPFANQHNLNRLDLAEKALRQFWPHFAVHTTLLQGLVPQDWLPTVAYTIVGQAWSVSLEWQFYLIAPIFFACCMNRRYWVPGIFCLFGSIALTPFFSGAFFGNGLPLFTLGIASHFLERYARRETGLTRQGYLILMLLCLDLILVEGKTLLIPCMIWLVVFIAATSPSHALAKAINRLLSSKPLVYLGMRSYSLYLVHMIPLYLTAYVFGVMGINADIYRLAFAPTVLIAAYFLAHFTFSQIESRGVAWGDRILAKSPTQNGRAITI